jgi:hypothetical protein
VKEVKFPPSFPPFFHTDRTHCNPSLNPTVSTGGQTEEWDLPIPPPFPSQKGVVQANGAL